MIIFFKKDDLNEKKTKKNRLSGCKKTKQKLQKIKRKACVKLGAPIKSAYPVLLIL